MLSEQDARACLETAAAELKEMSYEELEEYAQAHGMFDSWQSRETQVDGKTIYINTMLAKYGRIHKRISVEMILGAEDRELPRITPIMWFERYKSGRFYPSPREDARIAATVKALPYALLVVVVIALLGVVWHLFLRGG
ncbi:MAG: hypothetical protein IID37_09610 [Planctomycetes bacterium]|nr:hypothetical protein [Planctomycetota bacterium]